MTAAQRKGLWLFTAGAALFLLFGLTLQRLATVANVDLKGVYYGTRCLLQHHDPYNEADLGRVYQAESSDYASTPPVHRRVVTLYVNLPTTFPFIVPFAIWSWGLASTLWMSAIAVTFLTASYLMWRLCAHSAPILGGALIALFLCGSELLIEVGNAAGISVSLCVIGVWCILRNRLIPLGLVCFAISLEMKPHVAGLIWLYFLLAGGQYRKRAWQVLAVTVLLGLPGILWVSAVAPRWIPEMQANLHIISGPGSLNDPGPATVVPRSHGAMVVSLQTVFAVFKDDPAFYNRAAQLFCAPFLLLWAWITLRNRPNWSRASLGIAAITALSMLPIYHRQHDSRILLLTFPACAMLWAEGGITAWLALAVQLVGTLLTGDIPMQLLAVYDYHLHTTLSSLGDKLLTVLLARPAPLAMLLMGVFYLAVYWRRCRPNAPDAVPNTVTE